MSEKNVNFDHDCDCTHKYINRGNAAKCWPKTMNYVLHQLKGVFYTFTTSFVLTTVKTITIWPICYNVTLCLCY